MSQRAGLYLKWTAIVLLPVVSIAFPDSNRMFQTWQDFAIFVLWLLLAFGQGVCSKSGGGE